MKKDVWFMLTFALLFLAACGMSYMFYAQNEESVLEIDKLTKGVKVLSGKVDAEIKKNQDLSRLVGYNSGTGSESNLEEIKTTIRGTADVFPADMKEAFEDDLTEYMQLDEPLKLEYLLRFYKKYVPGLTQTIATLQNSRETLETEKAALSTELDQAREDFLRVNAEQEEGFETQLTAVRTERDGYLTDYETEKEAHEKQNAGNAAMIAELNGDKQNLQVLVSRLKRENDDIRSAITPKLKTVSIESDGRVVYVADDYNTVYVDLSARHKIRPGLEFQVFRERKDGTWVMKGTIEIKKVMSDMSEARIIDLRNKANPIMTDDLIVNIVFDPDKVYHVALIGSPSGGATYSKDMLIHLIQDSGGTYDEKVTSKTDYVVVLSEPNRSDENWKLVKDFGKEVMNVRQFLDLFGRRAD